MVLLVHFTVNRVNLRILIIWLGLFQVFNFVFCLVLSLAFIALFLQNRIVLIVLDVSIRIVPKTFDSLFKHCLFILFLRSPTLKLFISLKKLPNGITLTGGFDVCHLEELVMFHCIFHLRFQELIIIHGRIFLWF